MAFTTSRPKIRTISDRDVEIAVPYAYIQTVLPIRQQYDTMFTVIIMEQSKRKSIRIKGYDYNQNGYYFITICTQNRQEILSNIVGDGVYDIPKTILSPCGEIVEKYIQKMNGQYDNVRVEKYVIMPNHIHFVLSVTGNGMSQAPSPTNAIVPKFVSLFKRYCNREYGENLFQRSFYDHIIRNEEDYREILQYIENNPLKYLLEKMP